MLNEHRLAPGLVWPVRSQDLGSALGEIRDQVQVVWVSWIKQPSTSPIAATWAPLQDVMPNHPSTHRGLMVWIYPIAKQDHQRVREVVRTAVLPDLVRWCADAVAAPEGWTLTRHSRRWSLNGDTATATEQEGVATLRW